MYPGLQRYSDNLKAKDSQALLYKTHILLVFEAPMYKIIMWQ